jgi:hypothetical protein
MNTQQPGLARTISCFHFPDVRAMAVLDAGSATGVLAFEIERRESGA